MPEDEELYVFERAYEGQKLLVVCSFTNHERSYSVPEEFKEAALLVGNYENSHCEGDVVLRPYEAFVLILDK